MYLCIRDTGADEIAAIMSYQNTLESEVAPRTMVIARRNGGNQSISTVSRLWEPLAYPSLFPHGTLGLVLPADHDALEGNVRADDAQDGGVDTPDATTTQI
jgi:hypothetical protein